MKKDFIIIGAGIAGSSLAWRLSEAGANILLISQGEGASLIAGGVINPLSGKRFAYNDEVHARWEALEEFYYSLKPYQKEELLEEKLIYRNFSQDVSLKDFQEKIEKEKELYPFIVEIKEKPPLTEFIGQEGVLIRGKRINVPATLKTIQEELIKRNQFLSQKINLEEIDYKEKEITIPSLGIKSKNLILSQGFEGYEKSPFAYLPFKPAKGERILVEFEKPLSRQDILFKKYEILAPISETQAFFGATFEWENLNIYPSEEKKAFLSDKLKTMVNVPFKIIDHQAHVRPATKDRKIFLGKHPSIPSLFIFNGLGALGLSIAPLASQIMKEFLLEGKEIPLSMNIERFKKKELLP